MSERKCPKCGEAMREAQLIKWGSSGCSISGVNLLKPYVCRACGYVEFYAK